MLASTWLTVVVVLAFILLSVAGAMLPQVGAASVESVEAWQGAHSTVTWAVEPLGLFRAFSSVPFMVLMTALAVNMVACTARRVLHARKARGTVAIALGGSLVLHVGLLVVLAGGVTTAGLTVDGRIVTTEGQAIDLSQDDQYLGLNRGVWAGDSLPAYAVGLEKSRPPAGAAVGSAPESELAVAPLGGGETLARQLAVNHPVRLEGAILTHADWGYSPLLTVVSPQGEVLVDAYVALASSHGAGTGSGVYQDVLDAPGLPGTILVRLYTDFHWDAGRAVSASPDSANPAVELAILDEDGTPGATGIAMLGSEVGVAGYNFVFGDLRRWTAIRVRSDAGRPVVYAGFVIGFLGLLVRYVPTSLAAVRADRRRQNGVGE